MKSKCCVEGCLLYVYVSPSISSDYTYESWTLHDYDSEIQLKYCFFTLNPVNKIIFSMISILFTVSIRPVFWIKNE